MCIGGNLWKFPQLGNGKWASFLEIWISIEALLVIPFDKFKSFDLIEINQIGQFNDFFPKNEKLYTE